MSGLWQPYSDYKVTSTEKKSQYVCQGEWNKEWIDLGFLNCILPNFMPS
jgi:hypothetical protein